MKTSMKLTIKTKKLKELSKDKAQLVGGGATDDSKEPQQAQGSYWPSILTCHC